MSYQVVLWGVGAASNKKLVCIGGAGGGNYIQLGATVFTGGLFVGNNPVTCLLVNNLSEIGSIQPVGAWQARSLTRQRTEIDECQGRTI